MLADWLERSRIKRGLTQAQLAEKAGVSRVLVNQVENGKTLTVSALTLARLIGALRLQPPQHVIDESIADRRRAKVRGTGHGEPVRPRDEEFARAVGAVLASTDAESEEEQSGADQFPNGPLRLRRTDPPEPDLRSPESLPHNVEFIDDPVSEIAVRADLDRPGLQVVRVLGESAFRDIHPGDFIVLSAAAPRVNNMLALVNVDLTDGGVWSVLAYVSEGHGGYELLPLCSRPWMLIPYNHAAEFIPAVVHIAVRRIEAAHGEKSLRIIHHPSSKTRTRRRKLPPKE